MKKEISLNGEWDLYYFNCEVNDITSVEIGERIKACVPGNVELSLAEAGIIDKELFKGMATQQNQVFEDYEWWYKKEFEKPDFEDNEKVFLCFGAVDCFAEYYINGEKVYESENAFIEQKFEITSNLKSGINTIYVHIKSATRKAFDCEYNQYLTSVWAGYQSYIRKPAHCFGWDIFPRTVSAGIWRDVNIVIENGYNVRELSYYVKELGYDKAIVAIQAITEMPYDEYKKNVAVRIRGCCGESKFEELISMNHFKAARAQICIDNPKLWWPKGYGVANVYDMEYELLVDGAVRDAGRMNMGIRIVELRRTETMEKESDFRFIINGTEIMCKGSNWVPLDAYHSRDRAKYQKALALFDDTYSNIVRVWGGGVYEQEEFYDYCDRHGIMVWQDFMVACRPLSMDENTLKNFSQEAEWCVKSLRHHPSIILWSGDNEVDETLSFVNKRTGMNMVNRQLLLSVVERNDSGRPYLASSPYVADDMYLRYPQEDIFPERHLWGARDYYKADYYSQSKAHFVSEIGYSGCPCVESVRKMIDEDCIWPIYNEQWSLHSSDQTGRLHRVQLMEDQIVQLFGFKPDNLEDFSLASQISQAEAKKYFIERMRTGRPEKTGIIWWNMLDGWPQMSDAVVDYFFEKKLAYYYIKQSQQPVVLMIDELKSWCYRLVVSNDTQRSVSIKYKVFDVDSKVVYVEGNFFAKANQNARITEIRLMYSDKKFLVIEWEINEKKYYNHYLCGMPGFDYATYKKWLNEYAEYSGFLK